MRKLTGTTIKCFTCNKSFYKRKWEIRRRFCSHPCYAKWKKGNFIFKTWLGKIRPDMRGDKNPSKRKEVRKKMSDGAKGRTFSLETIKKMSIAKIGKYTGDKHPNWQGGKSKTRYYKTIRLSKKFYVYEHRIVAEKMIGRKLKKGEVIHHKDGNGFNNKPENLQIMTQKEHIQFHKSNPHIFLRSVEEK